MIDRQTRLIHLNGKWQVMARNGIEGATGAVWLSLGGCACQFTAVRVWLACMAQDKR